MPVAFSNAVTMRRHHPSCTVQYRTSSPCASAVRGDASASAPATPKSQLRNFMDLLLGGSACNRDTDQARKLSAKRVVGRDDRVAGFDPVSGEEIVGVAAGFAHEQNARRAV